MSFLRRLSAVAAGPRPTGARRPRRRPAGGPPDRASQAWRSRSSPRSSLHHQPVDRDRPRLPDPMRAVGGLILHRRVPPRVQVDDIIGGGEVQPGAARLEADQEDIAGAGLKGLDPLGRAGPPGPSRRDIGRRTPRVEGPPAPSEMADELAEDQALWRLRIQLLDQSRTSAKLGAAGGRSIGPTRAGWQQARRNRVISARIWICALPGGAVERRQSRDRLAAAAPRRRRAPPTLDSTRIVTSVRGGSSAQHRRSWSGAGGTVGSGLRRRRWRRRKLRCRARSARRRRF